VTEPLLLGDRRHCTQEHCIQGKRVKAVAAAKRHTIVLTEEGSVYTWGHRVVTPKRVILAGELALGVGMS